MYVCNTLLFIGKVCEGLLIEKVTLKLPIQDQVSNTLYGVESMAFEIETFFPKTDVDQLDLEFVFLFAILG